MKIKEELQELEARRVAFTAMLERSRTEEERAHWEALLQKVTKDQTEWAVALEEDPFGFQVWFVMEENATLLKQQARFPC